MMLQFCKFADYDRLCDYAPRIISVGLFSQSNRSDAHGLAQSPSIPSGSAFSL